MPTIQEAVAEHEKLIAEHEKLMERPSVPSPAEANEPIYPVSPAGLGVRGAVRGTFPPAMISDVDSAMANSTGVPLRSPIFPPQPSIQSNNLATTQAIALAQVKAEEERSKLTTIPFISAPIVPPTQLPISTPEGHRKAGIPPSLTPPPLPVPPKRQNPNNPINPNNPNNPKLPNSPPLPVPPRQRLNLVGPTNSQPPILDFPRPVPPRLRLFGPANTDQVDDGLTFGKISRSHLSSGVAYNFRGVWNSGIGYTQGDEVVYLSDYWVALNASINSTPASGNTDWQVVGTYSAFLGAWSSTTTYAAGAEVTYAGNFWVAVNSNTNSAPTTSNPDWQIAGPTNLDNIADGSTYLRTQGVSVGHQVTLKGLIGDSSGDTSTNLIDGGNKRFLHPVMSAPVQNVVNSSSEIINTANVHGRTEGIGTSLQKLNSSGLLTDADQIAADGLTYGRVKGSELSTGFVKQVNDGTNVRNAADIGTVIKIGGDIQSSAIISGRTEGVGTTVQKLNSSGLLVDADQVAADGVDYLRNPQFSGAQIVVDNPNFLAGTAGWTNLNAGSITLAQDTTSPFTNGKSLKATTSLQFQTVVSIKSYKAAPGDKFYFAVYMKSDGTYSAFCDLQFFDGAGTLLTDNETSQTTSTSWAQFTVNATAPANTAYCRILLLDRGDAGGASQSAWATDVHLVRLADLTNEVADTATHGRVLQTALTSNQPDLSKAGVLGKTLANIADDAGSARFAVVNAAGQKGVSAVDAANRALIDFTQSGHLSKNLDNIADTPTFARLLHVNADNTLHVSTSLNNQGNIPLSVFSSSFISISTGSPSTSTMVLSWSATTVTRGDGSTLTIPASSSLVSAPAAPTLGQVAGGTLGARTRYARIGIVKNGLLVAISPESNFAVSANNLLKITSPASVSGTDGWVPFEGAVSLNTGIITSFVSGINISPIAFGTDWTEPSTGGIWGGTTTNNVNGMSLSTTGASWVGIANISLLFSTTYYFYPFYDLVNGIIWLGVDSGAGLLTAKDAAAATVQSSDQHIALSNGAVSFTTPSSGGTGSGSGGGSGGGRGLL